MNAEVKNVESKRPFPEERVLQHYTEIGALLSRGTPKGKAAIGLVTLVQLEDGKIYIHLSGRLDYARAHGMMDAWLRDHVDVTVGKTVKSAIVKDEDGTILDGQTRENLEEGI